MAFGLVLQAPPTGVAATREAAPVTKNSQAVSPEAKPETDAGAKDPGDFPRPPGLVRKSYDQDLGKVYDTEIATYHAEARIDETVARYVETLQAAGWKKKSDSVSGSDIHLLRMIEWQTPAKEAEIRFYAAKKGSDLRVRIFTYKTTPATNQAKSGPGAPAKDTLAVKAAPAAQANAAKTNASAGKFGGAPLGPPPTNFSVQSYNPYSHNLSWSFEAGATCDLYRVDSTGRTQVADKVQLRGMMDHAYLEPNTVYRVVVHYQDGREGSLDYTYANPPQPAVITGLKAVQTGPGKVKLTWNRAQPAVGNSEVAETYQVTSPTDPTADKRLGVNSLDLTGLPLGNHWVRVAMVYGDSSKMAPAPKEASVNFDVLTDRNRYRITFLGLECVHETADDPFQLDGKRDEVYAGAYTVRVTRQSTQAPPATGSFVRTKVMGDTNGFPSRVRAGTASTAGGIQTGDFVPSSAAMNPQPGVATTTDQFPLLVWEGELRDSSDLLVIAPVLFAWNKEDESRWNSWAGWWSSPNGSAQLRDSARQGVKPDKLGLTLSGTWQRDKWAGGYIDPLAGSFDFLDPDRKHRYGPGFDLKADRPIGLEDQHGSGALNVPDLVWAPRGLVLTRTNLEAKLGGNAAIVYPWAFIDETKGNTNASLEGDYRLYIQIERLAPPP